MLKNRKIFEAILFFFCGGAFWGLLMFIFIKLFEGRLPVWQEFLPVSSLLLISIFIAFRE